MVVNNNNLNERINSIYNDDPELKEHFYLKIIPLKEADFLFIQLTPESTGKDLESIILPLDRIFTNAQNEGFLNLIFSFKDVTYFADLGFTIIISNASMLHNKKGKMIFCDMSPKIRNVMTIMELDKWFEIYDSEEEMITKNRLNILNI